MAEITSYKDLPAWQAGMDNVVLTYAVTADFPAGERFGLVAQMRRASVSVPSNVAEGQAVRSPRWSLRYIVTAIGSTADLETQLEAAVRLNCISRERAGATGESLDRAHKLLYGMRRERHERLGISLAGWAIAAVLMALRFS